MKDFSMSFWYKPKKESLWGVITRKLNRFKKYKIKGFKDGVKGFYKINEEDYGIEI